MRTVLGVLVSALLVIGCSGSTPSAAPAAASAAGSSAGQNGAFGGTVKFNDGGATTTTVEGVADGTSVSGTAVTQAAGKTHNVTLECASRNGDTWAVGGKVDSTTFSGETAGAWSAVIVKDGSPQKVGIWLSDDPSTATDCKAWLTATDFSTIGPENFTTVASGSLSAPTFPAS